MLPQSVTAAIASIGVDGADVAEFAVGMVLGVFFLTILPRLVRRFLSYL